jgi:hypothetical protein
MPSRHKPNMPGKNYYRSKANQKLRTYRVELRPDTLAAWKEAAALAGMSLRQATEYVYRAFAREQGIDIAPHPGPNRSKPPSPDC